MAASKSGINRRADGAAQAAGVNLADKQRKNSEGRDLKKPGINRAAPDKQEKSRAEDPPENRK